jgi:hypothetical protein
MDNPTRALNLAERRGALTTFVATPHSYAPSHPLMYGAEYRRYFVLIFIITVLFVIFSPALIMYIVLTFARFTIKYFYYIYRAAL